MRKLRAKMTLSPCSPQDAAVDLGQLRWDHGWSSCSEQDSRFHHCKKDCPDFSRDNNCTHHSTLSVVSCCLWGCSRGTKAGKALPWCIQKSYGRDSPVQIVPFTAGTGRCRQPLMGGLSVCPCPQIQVSSQNYSVTHMLCCLLRPVSIILISVGWFLFLKEAQRYTQESPHTGAGKLHWDFFSFTRSIWSFPKCLGSDAAFPVKASLNNQERNFKHSQFSYHLLHSHIARTSGRSKPARGFLTNWWEFS